MLAQGDRSRRLIRATVVGGGLLLLGGSAFGGCAAGDVVVTEDDGNGSTTTTTTSGGGGMGGSSGNGGNGGEGASTNICGQDCSTFNTPPCFQSVCNEGNYPGPVGQCVVVPEDMGTACDDGEFCTTMDSCDGNGVCVGGPQNTCGMTAPECNEITCDEATDSCSNAALVDGTTCVTNDLCLDGATCVAGACTGGTPKDCFFSPVPNECFVAVCNPMNGMCEPQPGNDGGNCTDSMDLCTVNKTCSAGMCQGGVPKDCSGLTAGCNIGQCDTVTGQCMPMAVPNGGMCDDLNACTTGETCSNGMCNNGTNITACTSNDNCCPTGCQGDDPLLANYDLDCASCDWIAGVFPFNHQASSIGDMTFDDQCDLYYATDADNVFKVNRNTAAPQLLSSFSGNVRGIVYHPATNLIYVTNVDKIFSMTKGGGNVTQLPSSTTASYLNGLTVAPPGWGTHGGKLIAARSNGDVVAFDTSTGQPTVVGSISGAQLSDVDFDGNTLYVAAYNQGQIFTMSSTGQATSFATAGCSPDGLAINENQFVYFACGSNSTIGKAQIPGGMVTNVMGPSVSLNGGWAPAALIFDGLDNLMVMSATTIEVFTP